MARCAYPEQCWLIKPLTRAQAVQDRRGGEAVGYRSDRGLEGTERVPALGAEPPVRFPGIIALLGQKLLQFVAFGPAKHALMPRPWLCEGLAAAQTIAEVADRHRISFRRVVLHD